MNPIKIVALLLIVLGVAFRAISMAYFNLKLKEVPPGDARARRHFEIKKRNALWIDAAFVVAGFYVLIRG